MKKYEGEPRFEIGLPKQGDENELAEMHIQAWKESYMVPESGLTNEKIDELLGHMLVNTEFRTKTIIEALEHPERSLYRIVRNESGEIVGFFHGTKGEQGNKLDAIYLLNEAKGSGTGGQLMEEFLSWIDKDKPTKLEVFPFNDAAIGFYEKYGFIKTDKKVEPYKGMLPVIEMMRPEDSKNIAD